MYEVPKLNRVGEAQDVILGVVPTGEDIDTLYVPGGGGEWADDGEDGESV